MAAAIVADPTPTTAATRMPATIDGNASGSSTSHSRSRGRIPIAIPASRIEGSMPFRPAMVVRTIGRRPYRIRTTMAARAPTPPMNGTGSRKPNIARLGTVCTMFAIPTSGAARRGRRAAKMPSGRPMAIAMSVEIATISTCCDRSTASSPRCASQKANNRVIPNAASPQRTPRTQRLRFWDGPLRENGGSD